MVYRQHLLSILIDSHIIKRIRETTSKVPDCCHGKLLLCLRGKMPARTFAIKNWIENIMEPICHLVKTQNFNGQTPTPLWGWFSNSSPCSSTSDPL